MAKKKDTRTSGLGSDTFSEIKDTLKQVVASTVVSKVKDAIEDFAAKTNERVHHIVKKTLESVVSALVLFVGIVFLLVGVAVWINNHFGLEDQWGFMMTGGVVVLASLGFMKHIKKTSQLP